jgi:hypothetical protein
MREFLLRNTIPVFINSFNQPTYLKNIVNKFSINGFRNIFILDNGSSSPELKDYYHSLEPNKGDVSVLYYNENRGPRYFHESGLYELLGGTNHLYTDPDLDFDTLPPNFVSVLLDLSEGYKIAKVGCALEIPSCDLLRNDLKMLHFGRVYNVQEWETQFWSNKLQEGVYQAPIDTTLHLFNPRLYDKKSFMTSLRVALPGFTIRHRPWYKDDNLPAEEWQFYKAAGLKYNTWNENPTFDPANSN